MNSIRKSLLLLAVLFMTEFAANAEGITFHDLSLKEGLEKAKAENKKVFIDVYATWCGPCKYLSKSVFVDENLGAFMDKHFISLKIDGEKGDGINLMRDFSLSSYPTMLFLEPDMTLLKKLVGAVGADVIQNTAMSVLDPESMPIFKMNKRYEEGDRDRKFLSEYIPELMNNEGNFELVALEFIKLYPKLNLEDKGEFLVFCIGVTEHKNKLMKKFLKNIEHYNELHSELAIAKVNMMLYQTLNDAQEAEDKNLIRKGIEKLYPYYDKIIPNEQRVGQEDLIEYLEGTYDSNE